MNWEQIVQQILSDGKLLGTKAFELSLLQVQNVIRIDTIWAIIFSILLVISLYLLIRGIKEDNEYFCIPGVIGTVISFIFSAGLWTNVIMYSGNPQWYAAKWMLASFIK